MAGMRKRNKYLNKKVEALGKCFDSRKEAERYLFLLNEEKMGRISRLTAHPAFELLPKMTETVTLHLKTKDKNIERTVQQPVRYTADFSYTKDGKTVVEDVKPSPYLITTDFKLRAKMMRYFHGIDVRVVYDPSEPI